MVHVRELDGRVLSFGHRGWLWENAYLLYDEETDSIWHHQTGWAMAGPLRGRALESFPVVQSTFEAWRREHPGTLVLPKPAGDPRPLDVDTYAARNATLSFGLGVDLPTTHRLYPFDAVGAAGGLVLDEREGVPLVVVLDPLGRAAHAYDRRVDGQRVELLRDLDAPDGPLLRERDGDRAWRLRSGLPVPGSGARAPLRRLLSTHWETGAWARQHPAGERWSGTSQGTPDPGGGR